ncbi:MAG: hypothetical protein N3A59_07140 [Thermodesulfovibrionales bacterium]|nr:hypothetical protein [Thermodesulfovibrionales bacterium]
MAVEPTKKVFETPYVVKKEEGIRGFPPRKKKNLKKTDNKPSKIDIKV